MKHSRGRFLPAIAVGACLVGVSITQGEESAEYTAIEVEPVGPDVTVPYLFDTTTFGYNATPGGLVTAMAVGFAFCSSGSDAIQFQSTPSIQHPVMRSSMFRLSEGRLEQIGISWVYHGFFATNNPNCGDICEAPPDHDGNLLYPGCDAPESSILAGHRQFLTAASRVNAHVGQTLPPYLPADSSNVLNARLQVHNADLDPSVHSNALFFVEAQALAPDDAAAGNGNNNASHQRITRVRATDAPHDSCTGSDPEKYCFQLMASLYESQPAIRAWRQWDWDVVETDVQVPDEGLFIVAAKAKEVESGIWRYEYAVQNLNSDRSGRSFSIPLPYGVHVSSTGFHDVDYHSGEPYSGEDWASEIVDHTIGWSTEDYSINEHANALRWGTLYNFRFECDAPPGDTPSTLGLFKPGTPEAMALWTVGPAIDPDADGDFDLRDYSELLNCFSGGAIEDGYQNLPTECRWFDQDESGTVDLVDLANLRVIHVGPG